MKYIFKQCVLNDILNEIIACIKRRCLFGQGCAMHETKPHEVPTEGRNGIAFNQTGSRTKEDVRSPDIVHRSRKDYQCGGWLGERVCRVAFLCAQEPAKAVQIFHADPFRNIFHSMVRVSVNTQERTSERIAPSTNREGSNLMKLPEVVMEEFPSFQDYGRLIPCSSVMTTKS